jgi:magnesium chelatase family protein
LDRIDIQVALSAPSRAELRADVGRSESSAAVATRVAEARRLAGMRLAGTPWRANAEVPGPALRRLWPLPAKVTALAERAFERGMLTARGLDRVLRLAWTFADLAGRAVPGPDQFGAALDLRLPGWAT